ncbi:origin recognition complex subunit 6-like [Maniola hyperantus]|uniref:origin recognition complex subunit 6-like n=1 Tax=Aphantopus hyperantus TaxID=2795564 RepID=UPI0021208982
MAAHKTTQLATKLGLGEEILVINKAAEYGRLFQANSIFHGKITETCKTVICLDLAASTFGAHLDDKIAIQYSGLKGHTYANCKKTVESLLQTLQSNTLTVSSLCLSMECTEVRTLAENMLEEYQKRKGEINLSLPRYVCMAVYQACRLIKIEISKSKLLEMSHLTPAEWTMLYADWAILVCAKFATAQNRGRSPRNAENEIDVPSRNENKEEPARETYEDWQRRMLEGAYKELKELHEKQKKEEEERKIKEKQ